MADAKKPDAKGGGKPGGKPAEKPAPKKDPFIEIVGFIIFGLFLMYFLNSIFGAVTSSGLFSNGLAGLSAEGIVARHTRPIASLDNPIGVRVASLHDTSVYDSPGGKKIGTQKTNARGKIIQGPVIVNGVRYWYVQYDSGTSGWVAEEDIGAVQSEPSLIENILLWVYAHVWIFKAFSVAVSLGFIVWITYLIRKLTAVRTNVRALLYPVTDPSLTPVPINPKWKRILNHVDSLNPGDWRLAIIEADIMLGDILDKLSLPGETIGDKLKTVEKSDFTTLDNAWEAHKVRNQIAHEGGDFPLTTHEAKRVIDLYKTVFDEFKII